MVDLQTMSVVVTAASVSLYMVNLLLSNRREERSRKTEFSNNIVQMLGTKEKLRDFMQVLFLDWKDVDDFRRRYDHRVNPDSFTQRWSIWVAYDVVGYMLRKGLIDREVVFNSQGFRATYV